MAEIEAKAATAADQFNKANKALIESGQIKARGAADYVEILKQTAEAQDEAQNIKKVDDYIRKATEEFGVARDRLRRGEDQAKIEGELNKLRAAGVEITADQAEVIRRTITATERPNDQWDANQKAIKDAAKALEDAQAEVVDARDFPETHAAEFDAMMKEIFA